MEEYGFYLKYKTRIKSQKEGTVWSSGELELATGPNFLYV